MSEVFNNTESEIDKLQELFHGLDSCLRKISMGDSCSEADLSILVDKIANVAETTVVASSLANNLFLNADGKYNALDIIKYLGFTKSERYLFPFSLAIKDAALRLLKPSPSSERLIHFTPSKDFLEMLVHQITNDSVQVSDCAHSVLLQIARYCHAEDSVPWMNLCNTILTEIVTLWNNINSEGKSIIKSHTTIRVRYANTVTALACIGNYDDEDVATLLVNSLNELIVNGVFDDNQDVLLQVSIFDLISNNMLTPTSTKISPVVVNWLGDTVSTRLYAILKEEDYMMKSDALRLYSYIAVLWKRHHPGNNNSDKFESIVFKEGSKGPIQTFAEEDCSGELDRLALIDIISTLAKSDWLDPVCKDEILSTAWLRINNVAQPKMKSAIFHSMAQVLEYGNLTNMIGTENIQHMPSNEMRCSLIMDTFAKVNHKDGMMNGGIELLLSSAKSSFIETRLGAYELLRAIATFQARRLLIHGDCVDFLLSPEGETTKEGKEAKYEIIKALNSEENKQAMNILLSDNTIKKLEALEKKGPHHSPGTPWQLATQ